MQRRPLGNTGYTVGAIGLGCMSLSLDGRPDRTTAIRVIHGALDAGMTLLDTADVYCVDDSDIGHNERLVAEALAQWPGDRSEIVVATKGGLTRPRGDWVSKATPEHLQQACDSSLAALGVDCIQLYQLHAPDPWVPFEDSITTLAELKQQGKIQHIGLSNVSVQQIEQARAIVDVVSVQNRCNPYDMRSLSNGVIQYCSQNSLAFLPYSPVGGPHGHGRVAEDPLLRRIADQQHTDPYQVCLAWLLTLSPAVLPIPGASRLGSALSSANAAQLELSSEDLEELNATFAAV